DLPDIGFGFREVGVDGRGGVQIRRHVLEHVDPAGERAVAVLSAAGHVGPHIEAESLPDAIEAFESTRFREIPDPDVLAWCSPAIRFLTSLDLTLDVEAPDRLSRLESERLERDFDFGDPSLVGDARCGVPDAIPVSTQRLAVVRHLPVGSGTGRIHLE